LQSFAQALKNLDEDLLEALISKLTPEVGGLLKEQISILPSSNKRAEEQRFRILGIVNELVREGFILPVK
jgi:hypothetical protein